VPTCSLVTLLSNIISSRDIALQFAKYISYLKMFYIKIIYLNEKYVILCTIFLYDEFLRNFKEISKV
jgi:hypothetical protein